MKNSNYDEILQKIPLQKKVDYFSRNYKIFLQTQQQLLSLQLPKLPSIPKHKLYFLKQKQQSKQQQNIQESSVIQIIDSFSSYVIQKNIQQSLKIYKIIKQMKQHQKYKKYFNQYNINKIFRQTYINFIQNCTNLQILITLNQQTHSIKLYLKTIQQQILSKINTDLKLNSTLHSFKKTLKYLLIKIQQQYYNYKIKFKIFIEKQKQTNNINILIYFSKWINQMAKNYYNLISEYIYQQQEIEEILKYLGEILETSMELQSKGISLYSQLKKLISIDLPIHLKKIIEVVLQAFDTILIQQNKQNKHNQFNQSNPNTSYYSNNQLYQFVQFKTLNSINNLINQLQPITKKDYGKKCSSKKGILLINSFLMILLPLCYQNQKWQFLHQNIIQEILDKIKFIIDQEKIKLNIWDYYHLFLFFYQLTQGKVRHHVLFELNIGSGERSKYQEKGKSMTFSYIKDKLPKIKRVSEECRVIYENKLIIQYWNQILAFLPLILWDFKKYAETYDKPSSSALKPTVLSIELIFKYQQFFKQLQFRISKQHYEYIGILLFQYFIYNLQYILFWSYHSNGKNDKVFTLYKKQQKLLTKAKQFNILIQQIPYIKQKKILKLSNFTKYGLQRLIIDLYFFTDVYKLMMNQCQKIKCQDFLYKLSMILAKQLKNQPLNTAKDNYKDLIKQFVKVYEKQPEIMKKYLYQKKGYINNNQSQSNNDKSRTDIQSLKIPSQNSMQKSLKSLSSKKSQEIQQQ